jgi:hypothetical protein
MELTGPPWNAPGVLPDCKPCDQWNIAPSSAYRRGCPGRLWRGPFQATPPWRCSLSILCSTHEGARNLNCLVEVVI